MERVTGVGGVFVRAADASKLRRWYAEMLGIDIAGCPTSPTWSTSGWRTWMPCSPSYGQPASRSWTRSPSTSTAGSAGRSTPRATGSSCGNPRRGSRRSARPAAGPPGGQLVAHRVVAHRVVVGRLLRRRLRRRLGRQVGQRALDLLERARDRDAEHSLPALQQVDDLLRGAALVHRGAVGDERDAGEVGDAAHAQGVDGLADVLQRDARVEQPLDHLQDDDVAERVQPLGARAGGVADAGDDQSGAGPVVELAVADAGRVAGRHTPVADKIVGDRTRAARVGRLLHATTSSVDKATL